MLETLEELKKEVKPPAPPPPPKPSKEELWRLFASRLREAGIEPERYRKRFEEEWPTIEALSPEEAERVVNLLVEEVKREAVPPPPVAPPTVPPAVPVRPPTVPYWQIVANSEDLSYMLTFGVERFCEEKGGKYGLTLYNAPALASVLVRHINEAVRKWLTSPRRIIHYIAAKVLQDNASRIARLGIYSALKYMWSDILLLARDMHRQHGYPSPEDVTFIVEKTVKGKRKEFRRSGGRVYAEAVACWMYRMLGVEDKDIPEDLLESEKLINIWVSKRMPVGELRVSEEELKAWVS